jgi:hypothetical protein
MTNSGRADLDLARKLRIREMGKQVDALNTELQGQVQLLSQDELAVLASIKRKLNADLSPDLQEAANTVGGFVW